MAKRPNKPKKTAAFPIHLKIPGALAVKIDAEAAKLCFTRSEVIRQALWAFVGR